MRFQHFLVLVFLSLFFSGCVLVTPKPVPQEFKNFVGTWEGNGINLVITKDGGLDYRKVSGGSSLTITAPLSEIDNSHFKVNVLFFSQTFKVDKKPFQEGEHFRMIVDGEPLLRKEF